MTHDYDLVTHATQLMTQGSEHGGHWILKDGYKMPEDVADEVDTPGRKPHIHKHMRAHTYARTHMRARTHTDMAD